MAPGAFIAVCVLAGVAMGIATPVAATAALAASLALVSLSVLEQPAPWRRRLLLAALVALSVAYGARARDRALAPPILAWFDVDAPTGRLDAPVVVDGTLLADAVVTDAGVRLLIDAQQVRDDAGPHRLAGRLQAHVAGDLAAPSIAAWTRGRPIHAPVVLRRPQVWLNPGGPSVTWQRLRQPFDLAGSIKSASLVTVSAGPWWHEAAAGVRQAVRAAIAHYIMPRDPQSAAIVAAILIGDRAGLSDAVERRLQAAGTYHVIAISGGNVALVATLCFWTLRGLVRSARAGSLMCMAAVAGYGGIVGAEASVARAVVAACVYLAVDLAGLRPAAINVLALVALGLVVADPLMAIDVGAWLSFGATLGIILCAGRFFAFWSTGRDGSDRRTEVRSALRTVSRAISRAAAGLLSATCAAELALLPIAAVVFSRVSVAGLLCNFVAIPAMAVVQVAGLAVVVLGAWPVVAWWPAAVADGAARILVGSADLVVIAPWLSWRVPPPSLLWVTAFYASLVVAWWSRLPRPVRMAAGLGALTSAAVIVFAPGLEHAQPPPGRLRVTVMDVGQGDAILVQTPAHHALLVDSGGTSGTFDLGGRIVVPALWASGVRRLDWLAFTHPDIDHIGGALSVTADLWPREIWEAVPVPPHPARAALLSAARGEGLVWRQLLAGHAFEAGGVAIDVRHPPAPDWERQRTRNDDSLVLRLRYGDVSVLLTGDAGLEFERREVIALDAEESPAPLRILKVGHHGSLSSTTIAFVRAFRPQVALVSVGRGNLFGHPAADVIARLEDAGANVFRTDEDGAIVLETDGHTVTIHTMTGRGWTLAVDK
jgi:competence protein ComEC